jgi:hypothetical protein
MHDIIYVDNSPKLIFKVNNLLNFQLAVSGSQLKVFLQLFQA